MKRTIYIYINGIMTFPGHSDNWNGRAVTWTHLHTEHRAEKVEYYVGPISRILGQKKRAKKLATTISYYPSYAWNVILVAHSNGANVVMNALRHIPDPQASIQRIHLIAPAASKDYAKNGLNNSGIPTTVYIGGRDKLLRLSSGWGRIFGYGALGKDGPINALLPVRTIIKRSFGHSTWFERKRFHKTMQSITDPPMP